MKNRIKSEVARDHATYLLVKPKKKYAPEKATVQHYCSRKNAMSSTAHTHRSFAQPAAVAQRLQELVPCSLPPTCPFKEPSGRPHDLLPNPRRTKSGAKATNLAAYEGFRLCRKEPSAVFPFQDALPLSRLGGTFQPQPIRDISREQNLPKTKRGRRGAEPRAGIHMKTSADIDKTNWFKTAAQHHHRHKGRKHEALARNVDGSETSAKQEPINPNVVPVSTLREVTRQAYNRPRFQTSLKSYLFRTDLMAARSLRVALKILSFSRPAPRSCLVRLPLAVDNHGCSHASAAVMRLFGSTVSSLRMRSCRTEAATATATTTKADGRK